MASSRICTLFTTSTFLQRCHLFRAGTARCSITFTETQCCSVTLHQQAPMSSYPLPLLVSDSTSSVQPLNVLRSRSLQHHCVAIPQVLMQWPNDSMFLLAMVEGQGLSPKIATLLALICVLGNLGRTMEAESIFKEMEGRGLLISIPCLPPWHSSVITTSGDKVGLESVGHSVELVEEPLGFDLVSEVELKKKRFMSLPKTKLVCTIGLACYSLEKLERLSVGRDECCMQGSTCVTLRRSGIGM
ncbi:hypothetical protein NE237_026812 [Protea cynaroides]|uniref:Pentatricopeptide repeat-containing protein n=1 Tax=Protea cynaroides TaxID=273540 RepID=A0A9Q0GM75_9MAGN|nr:hypothetical protein NE237_026812 [Protea cynaroides]